MKSGSAKQTMLGVAMPGIAPADPAPGAPLGGGSAKQTMLGVAMPGIAPAGPAPGAPLGGGSAKQTMLGVAMPGIAPAQRGGPHHADVPDLSTLAPEAYVDLPQQIQPRHVTPIYKRPAFLVVIAGLFLMVTVALFAVFWPTHPPIDHIEATTDEAGRDVVSLTCESCPDGTVLKVGEASCNVKKHRGVIVLKKLLSVGDNHMTVQIDRPKSGRDETVDVLLPVVFRVRPKLSGLSADKPYVTIQVAARPGAKASVNGKAMTLDKEGKGERRVDISGRCLGQHRSVQKVQLQVPYAITMPDGVEQTGKVRISSGITPLVVFTPRPHMITTKGSFRLFGSSSPGATIELGGEKSIARKDGTFERTLKTDQAGMLRLRIRASANGLASRTATIEISRVSSVADTFTTWKREQHLDTKQLFSENRKIGQRVVLTGYVAEVKTTGHERVLLVDGGGACSQPPCLAKVAVSADAGSKKGQYVQVLGYLAELLTVSGRKVPVVDAALLTIRKKGHR